MPPGADFFQLEAAPTSKVRAILRADYWQNYQVDEERCGTGLDTDNPVLNGVLHQLGVGLQLEKFHDGVFVRRYRAFCDV
jgi:hypothetical protein